MVLLLNTALRILKACWSGLFSTNNSCFHGNNKYFGGKTTAINGLYLTLLYLHLYIELWRRW